MRHPACLPAATSCMLCLHHMFTCLTLSSAPTHVPAFSWNTYSTHTWLHWVRPSRQALGRSPLRTRRARADLTSRGCRGVPFLQQWWCVLHDSVAKWLCVKSVSMLCELLGVRSGTRMCMRVQVKPREAGKCRLGPGQPSHYVVPRGAMFLLVCETPHLEIRLCGPTGTLSMQRQL
jgi:hypothetical protein